MFSDDAIGFYLQADKKGWTPTLKSAQSDYTKFVSAVDAQNRKLTKAVGSTFDDLSNLVKGFGKLPDTAAKAYAKALTALKKGAAKPFDQPVRLVFTPKARQDIGKAVGFALSKALSKVRIRFGHTANTAGEKAFGFVGRFTHVPRFAKGGIVPRSAAVPGIGGPDTVPALLRPGEIVVPPEDIENAIARIGRLRNVLDALKQSVDAGVNGAVDEFNIRAKQLTMQVDWLDRAVATHSTKTLPRQLIPQVNKAREALDGLGKEAQEEVGIFEHLFTRLLGPEKFLAVNKALGSVTQGARNLVGASQEMFGGTGKIEDFVTNFNQMNRRLGMSRKELAAFKTESIDMVSRSKGAYDPAEFSESLEGLLEAGVRVNAQNHKEVLGMADSVAKLSKVTGASRDTVGKLYYDLTQYAGLATGDVNDLTASFAKFGTVAQVNEQDLFQGMQENIHKMGPAFLNMGKQQRLLLLQNQGVLTAALKDSFGDQGAGAVTDMISQAIGGDQTAGANIQNLTGFGPGQIQDLLQTTDGVKALVEGMARVGRQGSPQMFAQFAQMLNIDPSSLANIVNREQSILTTVDALGASTMQAGKGMGYLNQRTTEVQSTWQTWTARIYNSVAAMKVFGVSGEEIIDFMREFGLQNIHSAVYLGKTIGEMFRFNKIFSLFKRNKDSMIRPPPLPSVGGAGGGVGGAGGLGLIGGFIKNVGLGTGAAIEGVFGGLAAGLTVLTPALSAFGASMLGPGGLGFLALVGGLFAVAGAARVALPVFEVMADVAKHGIDAIVQMFGMLQGMSPSQILATGTSLLVAGPGIAALGAGVFAASGFLLLSIPGLTAFAFASKLFAPDAGVHTGVIASTVTNIAKAFDVDPDMVDRANRGVWASVKLIGGLAVLSAGTTLVGVGVGGGIIGKTLTGIRNVMLGDPMQNIVAEADAISSTVGKLVTTFGRMQVPDMDAVGKKVGGIVQFMDAYAKISGSVRAAGPTLIQRVVAKGGMLGAAIRMLIGDDFDMLRKESVNVKATVDFLVKEWSTYTPSKDLPKVAKTLEPVGSFLETYGKIGQGLKDAPIESGGLWKAMLDVFTGTTSEKINNSIATIQSSITTIINTFSDPMFISMSTRSNDAGKGIKLAADSLGLVTPLLKATKDAGDLDVTDAAGTIKASMKTLVDTYNDIGKWDVSGALRGMSVTEQLIGGTVRSMTGVAGLSRYLKDNGLTMAGVKNDLTISAEAVRQVYDVPVPNAGEMAAMTRTVTISGTVTTSDDTVASLVRELISVVQGQQGGRASRGNGNTARSPSTQTRGFAESGQ